MGFGHYQCQAKEDECLLSAVGSHFLQFQSQVLLISHLLPLPLFTKWKNINAGAWVHPLIFSLEGSLASTGQMKSWSPFLHIPGKRPSHLPALLLKSFRHKVRRKAVFVLIALARTPSLPLWLSFFPSLTFLKPQGNGKKAFVWGHLKFFSQTINCFILLNIGNLDFFSCFSLMDSLLPKWKINNSQWS